ncbi:MAG: CBS domain-containing protein [SAR202 cluster bacterium]|nr:CBS domain-containing protein [SAR202 cluster bacterium]
MDVSELMNTDAHRVDVETSIANAAQLIKDRGISCLVVLGEDGDEGIITDRDMALGCLIEGHMASECQVAEHMTAQTQTVAPDLHFGDASIMIIDQDFDNLPVVQNDILVGILSSDDIFQAIDREMTLSPV